MIIHNPGKASNTTNNNNSTNNDKSQKSNYPSAKHHLLLHTAKPLALKIRETFNPRSIRSPFLLLPLKATKSRPQTTNPSKTKEKASENHEQMS
jgi:hypothetical protein